MPFLDDLAAVLVAANVGTLNGDIFLTSRVAVPHLPSGFATLVLTKTPGTAPEGTHNSTSAPAYIQPGAQVLVRADDWDEAETMATAAYRALYAVRNQFINSGWYVQIRPLQEPFDAGIDDRGQQRVAFNVLAKYNKR